MFHYKVPLLRDTFAKEIVITNKNMIIFFAGKLLSIAEEIKRNQKLFQFYLHMYLVVGR